MDKPKKYFKILFLSCVHNLITQVKSLESLPEIDVVNPSPSELLPAPLKITI